MSLLTRKEDNKVPLDQNKTAVISERKKKVHTVLDDGSELVEVRT
jgi:hypothetical protein